MPSHGKRGGGGSSSSKKSKSTASLDNDEGSHIIFTNSTKDEPAKGKKKGSASSQQPQSSGGKDGAAAQDAAPKKPDTRALIGGASWTGKLPVNMLSEHCQKQKWEKPEYSMNKIANGSFVSSVTLRSVHPKTRETRSLPPLKLPPTHKHLAERETAVEARHFAAAYALFRVSSMKNIHMMLPPTYRDLWKGEFAELKKEDEKGGNAWMYEADPFTAQEERQAAKEMAAKAREKREAEREKEKGQGKTGGPGGGGEKGATMKGWTNVPKLELGRKLRAQIEGFVRTNARWNPHGIRMTQAQQRKLVEELTTLGFRKPHVEEAAGECKDREEVLEWLLVHVPEDDLPSWSLPEGYTAGLSMASGDLKREASLKRLSGAGYPSTLSEEFLSKHSGDESKALQELQNQLLSGNSLTTDIAGMTLNSTSNDGTWSEEMETLASIYDTQFKRLSNTHCSVELSTEQQKKTKYVLHVRKSQQYPSQPPVISLESDLPAYIRLSIYRQALNHAIEFFLGEPMIFNMVEWLQSEIPGIVENPGKLRDIASSAVVSLAPTQTHTQGRSLKGAKNSHRNTPKHNTEASAAESQSLLKQWQQRQESSAQQKMLKARQSLPAWRKQETLVQTVNRNQVTIISGETGSGKSTQSVQFILDDMIERQLGAGASIICTQPRRISALGLADRVSEERCSSVGQEVGYTIRGESKRTTGVTRITFVTTGVLLRRLQTSGGTTQDVADSLADISHVVVDEVHERSLDTDFLLILLRDVLRQRKDLKVILMSATLDAAVFENYFKATASVGKVEISGRTFPVEDLYLDDVIHMTGFQTRSKSDYTDDYDEGHGASRDKSVGSTIQGIGMRINYELIVATAQAIDAELGSVEGGILVFLPGTAEINRTVDTFRNLPGFHALPLHASLTPSEQRRVFPPAPKGKRKIIAATNVAETSITIEDIVAVVDTGKVKETSFDPVTSMVKLSEVWASLAACKQRRGRAGRVRAGKCYKLYTKNMESRMAERPEPEIRRVPLEQLCLSVRAMGIADIGGFLASALTPPEVTAVDGAIALLGQMGALSDGSLTALGRHLSMIPADLRCSKLMVYGALFGCLEACLTIASILTVRSPFLSPQAKRDEAKAARAAFASAGGNQGDLLTDLEAYCQWQDLRRASKVGTYEVRAWCERNFLSSQTLWDITTNRSQYAASLKEVGFLPAGYHSPAPDSPLNSNDGNSTLLRALVAGAFHPQVARIQLPDTKYAASASGAVALDPEARTIKFFADPTVGRVFVHPASTLFDAQAFVGNTTFLSYFTRMATSKVFIRDLTPFNAYSLLMFGGSIALDTLGRGLLVDGWLRLRGWARIGVLVSRLRAMLDGLLDAHLERPEDAEGMVGQEVVGLVRKLVEFDGLDR